MSLKIIFFSFFYYLAGVTDTLITLIAILTVSLTVFGGERRKEIIFGRLIKNWGKRIVSYTGSKVSVRGLENINSKHHYLILANHTSSLDIYLILGYLRIPLCFLSKEGYFKIPFIGRLMHQMGCVPINRRSVRKAVNSLFLIAQRYSKGKSIIIYPEGTRSRDGKIQPFKKGFIHIIEKIPHDCYLLPVTLAGVSQIQVKGRFKIFPNPISITIHPSILIGKGKMKSVDAQNRLLKQVSHIIKQDYCEEVHSL